MVRRSIWSISRLHWSCLTHKALEFVACPCDGFVDRLTTEQLGEQRRMRAAIVHLHRDITRRRVRGNARQCVMPGTNWVVIDCAFRWLDFLPDFEVRHAGQGRNVVSGRGDAASLHL